ncbi:MAG: FG-GAP-like repeat-containing protein [candidate division WOR-3 bacterium]
MRKIIQNISICIFLLSHIAFAQSVLLTYPSQNQLNVNPVTNIAVVFNVPINPNTINDSTFIVYGRETGKRVGLYGYDASSMTAEFNPAKDFAIGEVVTVILTKGIKTLAGNPLSKPYQWNFTIKAGEAEANFENKIGYYIGSYPEAVVAVDLNNDGYADVAVAKGEDSITVLLNNGEGAFNSKTNYYSKPSPCSIYASDLDNDGDIDLVTANGRCDSIVIFPNNGDGTFGQAIFYTTGDCPVDVIAADFNGDGYKDLAVANAWSWTFSVFMNNGNGGFMPKVDYPAIHHIHSVLAFDIDNDGDMDIAFSGDSDNMADSIFVYKNQGNGTFTGKKGYQTGRYPYAMCTSDFNGDGYADLAVTNYYHLDFSILLNNGNGSFLPRANYYVGVHPSSVFPADYDGDGDMDLAIPYLAFWGSRHDSLAIFFNDGNGIFSTRKDFPADSQSSCVYGSDIDKDGDIDLVVTNRMMSKKVTVFLNSNHTGVVSQQELPSIYCLSQNYPNPFNSRTTISYSIGIRSYVSLKIYDVLGREIVTLVDGIKEAGKHIVEWDGMNLLGQKVNSGIYFYRLKSKENFVITKKMILLNKEEK